MDERKILPRSCPARSRSAGTDTHKQSVTMKKASTTMKKTKSGSKEGKGGESPSQLIDARIAALGDWRGETLVRVRRLIKQADPGVVEEVKWRKPSNSMLGVPVWEHDGIICTGETYKNAVKLTFAKGASLEDLQASSTPASKATPGVPSISMRATRLMKRRSRRSFTPPWH